MSDFVVFSVLVLVMIFGAFVYVVLMILFPESVGIQGEIAQRHREEHQSDQLMEQDVLTEGNEK